MFSLKPLVFDKNEIYKKKKEKFQNPLRVQLQIGEPSNFNQTPHIHVFWRTDSEYNRENYRLIDFHVETVKNP